jgi:hypothetical protein
MANLLASKPVIVEESKDLIAARQELKVLESLSQGVSAQITHLSKSNMHSMDENRETEYLWISCFCLMSDARA